MLGHILRLGLVIVVGVMLFSGFYYVDKYYHWKEYPMYKDAQFLEDWTEANEFEPARLETIYQIVAVGKEMYKLLVIDKYSRSLGFREAAYDFSFVNRHFKPVTKEQAQDDACKYWHYFQDCEDKK